MLFLCSFLPRAQRRGKKRCPWSRLKLTYIDPGKAAREHGALGSVLECEFSRDSPRARDNEAPYQAESGAGQRGRLSTADQCDPRSGYMTKGKWGNKKTFAEIYHKDKSYLQRV